MTFRGWEPRQEAKKEASHKYLAKNIFLLHFKRARTSDVVKDRIWRKNELVLFSEKLCENELGKLFRHSFFLHPRPFFAFN